jgi:hypothetical protein
MLISPAALNFLLLGTKLRSLNDRRLVCLLGMSGQTSQAREIVAF